MKNKLTINVLAISGIILLLIVFLFKFECLILKFTGLPCISCGLTRGFNYILECDLINATKMNLLSIPIFISVLLFYILYCFSVIFKKDYVCNYYNFFVKHYKLIIFILLINWGINIVKYVF